MKKIYSVTQATLASVCVGMLMLFSSATNAQSNVKSSDSIEANVLRITKQIGSAVMAQKNISKKELGLFRAYYYETILKDRGALYTNIEDDSITSANTPAYVSIMSNKYSKLYDQFKMIPVANRHNEDFISSHTAINPAWPGACNAGCTNTDFENGTLSNWMACYAQNSSTGSSFSYTTPTCSGILGGVTSAAVYPTTGLPQVNITTAPALDPVCGAYIPQKCNLPGAGNYSVEIGDYNTPNLGVGILEQAFTVTRANCDFTYWYAVVLESPGGSHTHIQQPYFNVYMYDQNGNIIPFCGNYEVTADSAATIGGFKGFICNCSNNDSAYCKPWTAVFVPLKNYIGQCVTIKVVASDCSLGGHYGYGYFDAACAPLGIITSAPAICGNPITLSAPAGGASYAWTGPGPGCILGNPNQQTITVNCPGKYTVIIKSVISASCADTLDTTIVSSVAGFPTPNFTSDTVCVGNATQFTNTTTGTVVSYEWYFGDPVGGADSTSTTNPTFTYGAAGTYTVTLQATGSCGPKDTSFKVVVNPGPVAGWTAPPVCLNNPTTFTNTSTGSTVYNWNFGEPSSGPNNTSTAANPTHTYSACGKYLVTLAVGTAPCIDTLKDSVTVNPLPTPSFTASPVCLGQTTVFTDNSTIGCGGTITGWAWNFGDPTTGPNNISNLQSPTHVFSGTGTYNVLITPTSNNGCQSSLTVPVTIVPNPVAKFTSGPVCLGQPTSFTDLSTGPPTTWAWNFGDAGTSNVQNPTHTYGAAGTYTVSLVVTSGAGCIDSTTLTVVVNPPPTAAFTSTSVCAGTATTFTDGSTGGASWKWEFGDGGTSVLQNPTHTYPAAGTYNATEIVTSANGCIDSITNPVVVNPSPTGTVTVPAVCFGTASVFTCTTTMVGGTFSWNFGDGVGTSTLQNPTYTYTAPGTYNVYVVLTSATGCTDTAKGIAVVNPIPVANFTATTECAGRATQFTDKSTVATGTITGWAWNFGDGGTSTLQNPQHRYAACGTYNAMLTVTSNAGCTHDTTITVTVNPVPSPSFTGTDVCQGLTTTFTDASTVGCAGTITTWAWNFGDGGTSAVQNPTHTYGAAGTYTVTLTVTSNNGCDSSVQVPVTVYPLPVPAFTDNSPCQGNPTVFTNNSTVPGGGTIAGSAWRFGDGGTAATAGTTSTSHTYAAAGTYTVTLVVRSNNGCVDSISQTVTVNPNPVPDFKANDTAGCAPMCVNFTDLSTVTAPGNITGWLWNFGDGSSDSSSTLQNPIHCYNQVGVFTVTLTVTTSSGCTETFTRVNYITTWPTPVAKFTASPNPTVLVNNPTVQFYDQSQGNPVAWTWTTFGDGLDSVKFTQNTTHTYQDTGTFYVQLDIVNKYGCKDSVIEPVVVQPIWTFYVPNAFTPNGDGLNDGFMAKGVGIIKFEMWIFDRWGMQLYHCTDMQHPWDGTVQGASGVECQEDTYVWLIEFTDVFHNNHRYVGRVSIIK